MKDKKTGTREWTFVVDPHKENREKNEETRDFSSKTTINDLPKLELESRSISAKKDAQHLTKLQNLEKFKELEKKEQKKKKSSFALNLILLIFFVIIFLFVLLR